MRWVDSGFDQDQMGEPQRMFQFMLEVLIDVEALTGHMPCSVQLLA